MAEENVNQDELDTLYESVMTCEPAIPPAELEPLANLVQDNERVGRQWRLTALLASQDGVFFRDLSEDEAKAKALAPTVMLLGDFAKLLRSVADLADCASSRVAIAGCNHEKFNAWMEADHA